MITQYKKIALAEQGAAREIERLRMLDTLIAERNRAENALANIERVLSSPDESTLALLAMISQIDRIDTSLTTKTVAVSDQNSIMGRGSALTLPGGLNLASVLRTVLGDAVATSNRHRAALEQKLPEARLRVEEARRGVKKFEAKSVGVVTLPPITVEATGAAR